jgi:hypothetical protein
MHIVLYADGLMTLATRPRHDHVTVTCFNCQKNCHFNYECPDCQNSSPTTALATKLVSEEDKAPVANSTGNTGFKNLNISCYSDSDADSNLEFSFLINNNSIPSSWILLENQWTVDACHNPQLLRNIREVDTSMDIHCNAGTATTNLIWDFPGHGVVWFHPHGIANILSLSKVVANNHVMFDSKSGKKFMVKDSFGRVRIFEQSLRDLTAWTQTEQGLVHCL